MPLQDVKTLRLTQNTPPKAGVSDATPDRAQFVCPLTFKEMSGHVPFVYLTTCGCVFSQAGLKNVTGASSTPSSEEKPKDDGLDETASSELLDICPQCAKKFNKVEDIRMLNPPPDEMERMYTLMERRRAEEAQKPKGKKRKAAAAVSLDVATAEPPTKKKLSPPPSSANTNIVASSRAVASSLAMEEAKRKATMSDAVKSLYGPKDGSKRKETFTTMMTFTRVCLLSLS